MHKWHFMTLFEWHFFEVSFFPPLLPYCHRKEMKGWLSRCGSVLERVMIHFHLTGCGWGGRCVVLLEIFNEFVFASGDDMLKERGEESSRFEWCFCTCKTATDGMVQQVEFQPLIWAWFLCGFFMVRIVQCYTLSKVSTRCLKLLISSDISAWLIMWLCFDVCAEGPSENQCWWNRLKHRHCNHRKLFTKIEKYGQ